jgi:hypothetical protein
MEAVPEMKKMTGGLPGLRRMGNYLHDRNSRRCRFAYMGALSISQAITTASFGSDSQGVFL